MPTDTHFQDLNSFSSISITRVYDIVGLNTTVFFCLALDEKSAAGENSFPTTIKKGKIIDSCVSLNIRTIPALS